MYEMVRLKNEKCSTYTYALDFNICSITIQNEIKFKIEQFMEYLHNLAYFIFHKNCMLKTVRSKQERHARGM